MKFKKYVKTKHVSKQIFSWVMIHNLLGHTSIKKEKD